jgi:hypothetical protein
MRYIAWALVAMCLLFSIVRGYQKRDSARPWAWVTVWAWVVAVFIQITTEPCHECFIP